MEPQHDSINTGRLLPSGSIDLVLTDPPYGLNKKLKGGTWGVTATDNHSLLQWDKVVSHEVIQELFRISKNQIIWGGNYYQLPVSRCWLSWNKPNLPSASDFELAWTSFDKTSKSFYVSRNPDGKRQHPTQKPIKLMEWCVSNYSKEGMTILDPFMGSGTTGVACQNLKRDFIGIELDPTYFKIAESRIHGANEPSLERSA